PSNLKPVKDLRELAERLRALVGEKVQLKVLRAGKDEEEVIDLVSDGFRFGDVILGMSDVPASGKKYDPLNVTPLPADPRASEKDGRDPFAYRKRLRLLADEPVVMQVKRANSGVVETVLVPPAWHLRLGARMKMGPVMAIRKGSEAAKVGLRARVNPEDP